MQNIESEEKDKKSSPALQSWIEKKDRLADVDIRDTLEALGADPNQDGDRSKWKIQGVGNIIVSSGSQAWYNGNASIGNVGSVNLVMHSLGLDVSSAVKWLAERFPDIAKDTTLSKIKKVKEEVPEKSFTPPPRDDDGMPYIKAYLTGHGRGQRRLPKALIDREISSGNIYPTRNIDKVTGENLDWRCVFIGPSSAELRSVDPDGFKGCSPGSDSEHSGYQIMFNGESSKKAALVEAAITGLSLHTIDPSLFIVSTNGAGRFRLQYQSVIEFWNNGFSTALALDADDAGDKPCQKIFNALFLRDYLSEKYSISPEQVDSWILQKKILSDVDNNDNNTFFFGNGKSKDAKKTPKIIFYVPKTIGPLERTVKNSCVEIELTWSQVDDVLKKYRVERMRPVIANDWSEVLMKSEVDLSKKYDEKLSGKIEKEKDIVIDKKIVATGRFKRNT